MDGNIYDVGQLTHLVKHTLEREHQLRDLWVRGEISNFKHHSRGHMYFTLKDDRSRIRAVMFKGNNQFLRFTPQDGMNVLIRGQVTVYERDGQYQLYAREMQPDGIGALYQAYEQLKQKLADKGWFDPVHKQKIPSIPARIGVMTSPTGAAIRDILITLKRRYPVADILLFPVLVQGEGAPASIVQAMQHAHQAELDVLILGRGGGSIEELWAFNEELVAEAIFQADIPIISAVGHETDSTIADYVSDLRAPTPTAAAEMAVPVLVELEERISRSRLHMSQAIHRYIGEQHQLLQRWQGSYAYKYPGQLIVQKEQQLDQWMHRLHKAIRQGLQEKQHALKLRDKQLEGIQPQRLIIQGKQAYEQWSAALVRSAKQQLSRHRQQWEILNARLDALSPLKIMSKGYSLVYDQESAELYTSAKQVAPGQAIQVSMHDGRLDCHVWGVKEDEEKDEQS